MSNKGKNYWDILVKELELNNSLFKRTVELVLRNAEDPPPKIIRVYIADVLGKHRHWRRGNPNAAYKKWKSRELREQVKPEADRLIAGYLANDHKPYMAKEMAAITLSVFLELIFKLVTDIPSKRAESCNFS